ncbi:flavin-containing monooxygenase [Histidinibacterium lentulum]|uniref:FAD-dependent oxidoreductase n=1 Tax=Histidinibacterium lentulum TaxID=2480588 RepID=A0A3N2QWD3_9RHOB|nr:NAD(P)/FAD-dependent oxidoreductase [Histidinibacterium lentulum]ROT99467.1 FAD-dependent oxidoreductase [Histidinibacterium lentulum]
MGSETIDTVVIGGGQAGLAMSGHLSDRGIGHVVLERHRIAERWRSERWDSLVANGPAWHDRFPDLEFDGLDPDGFASKDQVVAYFEAYARKIAAPIRCGVEVTGVRPLDGQGFRVETSEGVMEARCVVSATGPFQKPLIPRVVPETEGLLQIHSTAYRNPGALPEGGVLVVGAGSSGSQIADELSRAGREVYLSVGPHDRPPRRYRGKDFVWWLGVLGKWEARAAPSSEHVTIAVSGAHGGRTVDFRDFAARGVRLVGRTLGCEGGVLAFSDDLVATIRRGDANYLSVLDEADAWVARTGEDLPEEPEARQISPDPASFDDPLLTLDLAVAGVRTIIWATGFALDFGWLKADVFDAEGRPRHERGVSVVPGLYFLGLPFLSCRGSSFIWGVWPDAQYLADHIAGTGRTAVA